ncbi:MAG: EamA family transporter [Rhodocyclaceae bacterium]|nr:EamA family transporter [Rhodocyclaceae bacterium]
MTENSLTRALTRHWMRFPSGAIMISDRLPELMLLMVAAAWGGSYAIAKQITLQVAVLDFLVLRFGLTTILLLPSLRLVFTREWRKTLVVGGLLGSTLFAIFLCETFGVSLTTATNAAFLISLCLVFTPIAEWIFLGVKPAPRVMLAAAACIMGAVLMIPGSLTHPFDNTGDWLILGAAVLRALMITITKRLTGWHRIPALALTAMQSAVVCLGSLYALYAVNGTLDLNIPDDMAFWGRLGFLVFFCTIFAFFAQNYAAARISPSRVAFLMGSEPVFGAIFAALLMGETLTGSGWVGALLIIIATTFMLQDNRVNR